MIGEIKKTSRCDQHRVFSPAQPGFVYQHGASAPGVDQISLMCFPSPRLRIKTVVSIRKERYSTTSHINAL
jgi:hypothetical protein